MEKTPETLLDYLTDPRDRALLLQKPILMMPRFGELPPLAIGERRFIAACDGLYLQARSRTLCVAVKYAATPPLPFGALEEEIAMIGGPIPRRLYLEIERRAIAHSPLEWAGVIEWNERAACYELHEPTALERSRARITYRTGGLQEDCLVADVHSHGRFDACFSPTDDESDIFGIYFASVLGRCESADTIVVTMRFVVDGFHYPLPWHPWEDSKGGADADYSTASG